MTGRQAKERKPISRLQWVGVVQFLSGVVALFAGAAFKATGTALLILLYLSFFLVAGAVLLFSIDWIRRRLTKGAKNDERERITGN